MKSDREKLWEALKFLPTFLENLEKQDNRGTALPIYFAVQELKCIGVVNLDYCYGDGDNHKIKYCVTGSHGDPYEFDTEEEAQQKYRELKNEGYRFCSVEPLLYKYVDIEYFLTEVEANLYINRDKHNLRAPRTYVKHFHYRNTEIRPIIHLLKNLPKILEDLNWATHMLVETSNFGLTKMMASGIRHTYQFPNYQGPEGTKGETNGTEHN